MVTNCWFSNAKQAVWTLFIPHVTFLDAVGLAEEREWDHLLLEMLLYNYRVYNTVQLPPLLTILKVKMINCYTARPYCHTEHNGTN